MLDLLKKIGVPATVAAVIATLVTTVPLLFKLDERYAKEEDLVAQTARTEKAINEITSEISRLAGTQQVVVSLMSAQRQPAPAPVVAEAPAIQPTAQPRPSSISAANSTTASVPLRTESVAKSASAPKFDEVSRALREQQSRLQVLKY